MNANVMHKMRAVSFRSTAWLSIGPAGRGRRIICKVPCPLSRQTRRARWWNLSPDRLKARGLRAVVAWQACSYVIHCR